MTIIQTITLRYDHMASQNHVHVWASIRNNIQGEAEQCAVWGCQAISVTHTGELPYHPFKPKSQFYGPLTYKDFPSDICGKCGGESPCSRCIPHLPEQSL